MRLPFRAEGDAVNRYLLCLGELFVEWLCPLSVSHMRRVLSSLPETMRLPSGLKATLITLDFMTGESAGSIALSVLRHPKGVRSCQHCYRKQYAFAVWAESDAINTESLCPIKWFLNMEHPIAARSCHCLRIQYEHRKGPKATPLTLAVWPVMG